MRRNWLAGVMTAAVCAAVAAQDRSYDVDVGKAKADWVEESLEGVADELGLDKLQQEQFDRIVADIMPRARAQGDQLNEKLRELRAVRGDPARTAELNEAMHELGNPTPFFDEAVSGVEPLLRPEQLGRLIAAVERVEAQGRGWEWNQRVIGALPQALELAGESRGRFHQLVGKHMGQAWSASRSAIEPLLAEMRAAREAGDFVKVAELRAKINALEMDPEKVTANLIAEFRTQLAPEQATKLDEWLATRGGEEGGAGADGAAGGRGPGAAALLRAARRSGLSPEQRAALRTIERETAGERRAAGHDGAKRAAVAESLRKRIDALLTPEQKPRFEAHLSRLMK
ncbi:MAG: hypothetical protein HRU75_00640 [Planctomycetia bacterium]|nr:MAG: hypothetical protein HRU75_00640 [Planctomycetia bacterium]